MPTNQLIDRRTLALRIMRRAYREVAKRRLVDSDIYRVHIDDISIDKSLVDGFTIYSLETDQALYKVSMDLFKFLFIVTIENNARIEIYSNIFGF